MFVKLRAGRVCFSHLQRTIHLHFCRAKASSTVAIQGKNYSCDDWTNVTPRVLDKVGRNLHNRKYHPIQLIRERIQNFLYANFVDSNGNPLFSVYDNMSPVVSVYQNFDSLLVPTDHVSRQLSDTYYINQSQLLRAHTSAHQEELIKMGVDNFLVVGDVYRRDAIDASHYPVFHQMEGVRLFSDTELLKRVADPTGLAIFEEGSPRTIDRQEYHTLEAAKLLEHDLKHTLLGVAQKIFGQDLEYRWVDCYFPFTHPSWELEIMFEGDWMEVLGSGIMEQKILSNAGAASKIGWAFGLGLDRLAMKLYSIPDIRLFWSEDSGFLNQFNVENPDTNITYKPISQYPQCIADVSFWIPETYSPNDFYDLVRSEAGDVVEQVSLVDEYFHPETRRISHCYRLVYRHMEKTFAQDEVNVIHGKIGEAAKTKLSVELRI